MFKKTVLLTVYTLFIIVISSLITTAYFHYFVLNQNSGSHQQDLIELTAAEIENGPLGANDNFVELFSYDCHYCFVHEPEIAKIEKRLPDGKKIVRIHINTEDGSGMARYAPVFATLSVMGVEDKYRTSVYKAVLNDKINLNDKAQLEQWLNSNEIDVAEYNKVRESDDVKYMLNYMKGVTKFYRIRATPTFVVNKRWIAVQDRDFSDFADNLISLLQNNKPLEK